MNIGDLSPAVFGKEFASVSPHIGKVGSNANQIYPQEPDRPLPARPVRQIIPPAKRLAEIKTELAETITRAENAGADYELALAQLPSDNEELVKAETLVRKLADQLRQAQEAADLIRNKPKPLDQFASTAVSIESTVAALYSRSLEARIDLDLEQLLGVVDRSHADIAIIRTLERKHSKLRIHMFANLFRAVAAKSFGLNNVENSIKRSTNALKTIAQYLEGVK
jgi:hypothetical protein